MQLVQVEPGSSEFEGNDFIRKSSSLHVSNLESSTINSHHPAPIVEEMPKIKEDRHNLVITHVLAEFGWRLFRQIQGL